MEGSAIINPSTISFDDSNCRVSLNVLVTPKAQYGFPTNITSQLHKEFEIKKKKC